MDYKDVTTIEEFNQAKAEFLAKHPELKLPKPIECLNLIMRKEFALEILNGTKTVEFRDLSEHYINRLIDKDTNNWMADHLDDDNAVNLISDVRPVKRIHFHNYNNSWTLDVEVVNNDYCAVIDKDVKYLQQAFNCHELDELLNEYNQAEEEDRPIYFYFALGKVIDSKGL